MKQKIKLNKGQVLSKNTINSMLTKARMTFDYAEFTMYNNLHITVSFTRDYKFIIATDSREYGIIYDIKVLHNINSYYALVPFVDKWIKILNK